VCADGIPHGEIHRFKGEARAHLARAKDSSCNEWYGPHVVVELTGTFTPKASKPREHGPKCYDEKGDYSGCLCPIRKPKASKRATVRKGESR
jgi:hypothetical protein